MCNNPQNIQFATNNNKTIYITKIIELQIATKLINSRKFYQEVKKKMKKKKNNDNRRRSYIKNNNNNIGKKHQQSTIQGSSEVFCIRRIQKYNFLNRKN